MEVLEKYEFKVGAKKNILALAVLGFLIFVVGLLFAVYTSSPHGEGEGSAKIHHAEYVEGSSEIKNQTEIHHGKPIWLKRVYTSLWHNHVFFIGMGLIGLFFVAVQYAAQAGWSASIKRVPLAMGSWIPLSGIITIVLWFFVKEDVFHWTHHDLYVEGADYDYIMFGKSGYFFWPFDAGGFPFFYLGRMVVFFSLWTLFLIWIRKQILAEDYVIGVTHWKKTRSLSAIFLVIFAITSSVAVWDWVMSIDAHWFSTMMGWYVFASWWVTGLAFITLIVVRLKEQGYLKMVNANHLHDLGKFVFAFSIFWAYIWFSQFMLIYYANIPEETIYFKMRMITSPYNWIFYVNIIMNFAFPFLLLMTRDAKRHMSMLKVVCPVVIIGHWLDFYNMIAPGVMQYNGQLGLIEIGIAFMFMAFFIYVFLTALAKRPLVAKNHPMLEEAKHHHI